MIVATGGICSGYPRYCNSVSGTDNTGTNDIATGDAQILWSFDAATGATGNVACPSPSSPSGGGIGNTAAAATTAAAPGTPNTGLALVEAHPLISLIITTLSAAAIVYIARHFKQVSSKK